jgi:hypothetical protein
VCVRERGGQHEDVDGERLIRHCRRRAERVITDRRIAMQLTVHQCQAMSAAYLRQLALIYDADELVRHNLHHLLPQQGSSTACQHTRERRGD